jgi:hypothetical protein
VKESLHASGGEEAEECMQQTIVGSCQTRSAGGSVTKVLMKFVLTYGCHIEFFHLLPPEVIQCSYNERGENDSMALKLAKYCSFF